MILEKINKRFISKNRIPDVIAKGRYLLENNINKSNYLLLPLTNLSIDSIMNNNLINTYTFGENTSIRESLFVVCFDSNSKKEKFKLKENIYLYTLKILDMYKPDYYRFLEGKYSEFSEPAKRRILQSYDWNRIEPLSNIVTRSLPKTVLYPNSFDLLDLKEYFNYYIEDLTEVMSIIDEKDETLNVNKDFFELGLLKHRLTL